MKLIFLLNRHRSRLQKNDRMTSTLLIANRGEIACRITRTAHRMGMRVVAVYSDADHQAVHVGMADEAVRIGTEQAADSYLDPNRIISAAKATGARFVHPGYGFLSENVQFARACADNDLIFVGPPASAIEAMGLKNTAKKLMHDAGVPVVPGYLGDNQDDEHLARQADQVGYPLLIKAVAGGGGKGMRKVVDPAEFSAALSSCRREAKAAFGDDRVLIERFVMAPRHIEVQVFCDSHGNAVHLFERDCSMQRRHQKVIEEAPAPGMSDAMRSAICAAALEAARAVGYVGAGTVEFIADSSRGLSEDAFYFMEMNTRLQVEHPVTEAITGIDLVEWQLRVAAGERLPAEQAALAIDGHAIEARLYAEDPANGFLPQTGKLQRLVWPEGDPAVRIDTGVREGDSVTPYYDPMLAKVICHATDRRQAIAKLASAIDRLVLLGMRTNLGFCRDLISSTDFVEARHDTSTIDENIGALTHVGMADAAVCLAVEVWLMDLASPSTSADAGPWDALTGWSLAGTPRTSRIELQLNSKRTVVDVEWLENVKQLTIRHDDREISTMLTQVGVADGEITAFIDDRRATASFYVAEPGALLFLSCSNDHITVRAGDVLDRHSEMGATGANVCAPMSGRIIALTAEPGQSVAKGDQLAILEAMKMEHPLVAGFDATVHAVNARIDDQVDEGFVVIELSAAEAAD